MQVIGESCRSPVKAVLFIPDITDRRTGNALDLVGMHRIGGPDFAGQNNAVGRGQRFAGHPGFRVAAKKQVHHSIRNAVANLVRMPFGHTLGREDIGFPAHWALPFI